MLKSTCIIFNPNAGRLSNIAGVPVSKNLLFSTLNQMRVDGWNIEYKQSEKQEDIFNFAKEAAEKNYESIIIVGGDGSMGHASQALINTNTAIGTFPAGSANVWAQQLGLSGLKITNLTALDSSMHKMVNSDLRKMDMGLVNQKPFLFWASFGFDARLVYQVENNRKYRQFTELHYATEAFKEIGNWQGIELELDIDGKKIGGKYSFAVVTNIRKYAGGLVELSPNAVFDDGEMDLWLINHTDISTTFKTVSAFLLGNPENSSDINRIPFKNLKIKAQEKLYYQLDGEPQNPQKDYDINVIQKSINVLIPNDTDQSFFKNQ